MAVLDDLDADARVALALVLVATDPNADDEDAQRLARHLPGLHDQKSHGRRLRVLTGLAALTAPRKKLGEMDDDPRAPSLWYRAGDNSLETESGDVGCFEMNQHMRHGGHDPAMDRRVADIDSVMTESKLPRAIEVYRGVQVHALRLGKPGSLKGVEFSDKAFVSTSTDRSHAADFGAVMTIRVPKGTPAVRMADREGHARESEILLDRDLRFRIVGERGTPYTDRWGNSGMRDHEIDVEVIP